jgi:hypothetical protein
MITEKDTIKCEAIFNDNHTHRYLWKRVWNKDKPLAAVIMLNPCMSDNIVTDTTTTLVVNNVARLEKYGGVIIVNLYSLLASKLSFRWNSDEDLNGEENDTYIRKAAEDATAVIIAWGKAINTNARIEERAVQVINLLEPYREKLYVISDGERLGLHPLTPAIRQVWQLVPFDATKQQKATTDFVEITDEDFNEDKEATTTALDF